MRKWLRMIWNAFLFILYLCCGMGVVAAAAVAISEGQYVLWAVIVLGGGSLVVGTMWYVIDRKMG